MPGPGALLTQNAPRNDGSSTGRPSSDGAIRATSIAAVALTFLLIAVGGLVRATDSGEGCSGWPKCSPGHWLPPLEFHAIIEYSHRMTAFLDIVVVALLAVIAWRRYRSVPKVFRPAILAVALIVVQAILGGIVVKGTLAPLLVTAHFATAMILAAVIVDVVVAAYTHPAPRVGPADRLTIAARIVAGASFVLLLVGAYVRGENAGLVFADWPLMNGRVVPTISSVPAALQFTHRLLAVVVGCGVAWLAARAWRVRSERRAPAVLAMVAASLFVAQVLIGAALVWTAKSTPAVVAHVAVSSLVWGALVGVAATARVAHGDAGRAASEPFVSELASRA